MKPKKCFLTRSKILYDTKLMSSYRPNQKGFAHIVGIIAILLILGLTFLYLTTDLKDKFNQFLKSRTFANSGSFVLPEQVNFDDPKEVKFESKKTKSKKVVPVKHHNFVKEKKKSHKHDSLSEKNKKAPDSSTDLPKLNSVLSTTTGDTTAPLAVSNLIASSSSVLTISASWQPASDPESAIDYYVFGIGTVSSGDYSSLANTRWWQVTYNTSVSVNMNLDLNTDYYVSVYAVNTAGLASPIITSNPVRSVWENLGEQGNVLRVEFSDTGYDANGNPATGWTDEQKTKMLAFVNNMYPILRELYGPPANSYTVTVVRDLSFGNSAMFIPELDQIRMNDSFYPQLLTHELLHAFRNDFTVTSNQNWEYDPTLSGFEEGFAQGVSYEAMNKYVQAYPNDTIVDPNSLWQSNYDWDNDYQNMPELRGTDFWSDSGGTGLHWLRYEMAAAALRKLNLESAEFYKRFNQEYYGRINASPSTLRPSRDLMVDIIKTLTPTVEAKPAQSWVDSQYVFHSQNVYGNKIFHRIQDYPWTELFAFQYLIFMKTMDCGSEWICPEGSGWKYHNLNGSSGQGKLLDSNNNVVWSGNLLIEPAQNPSDGYFGFGYDYKSLSTASSLDPWPGGNPDDYILNLKTLGLYEFQATFTDPNTNEQVTNSIYRVLGSDVANSFKGVWGAVVGHKNGTIYLNHEKTGEEEGIPVTNGVFKGLRKWTGIPNPKHGYNDSIPGKVSIKFIDSDTNTTYKTQRNIDYGSWDGSQMFLIKFTQSDIEDTVNPTVSVTNPQPNANVPADSTVSITADASDNTSVEKVEFLVDGSVIATDTSLPYTDNWSTNGLTLKNYSLSAKAFDPFGNQATSSVIIVTLKDLTKPTVAITFPSNSSTVKKGTKVVISANASDNRTVQKVEFRVNNTLVCTDTTASYTCTWNVGRQRDVVYTIVARAYDASGNIAETTSKVTAK